MLLPPTSFCACATSREVNEKPQQTERVDAFIPTHPPVVVPHSWRDAQHSSGHDGTKSASQAEREGCDEKIIEKQ